MVFKRSYITKDGLALVKLKFCLADFVYLIQKMSCNFGHLSNKYARIVMHSARLNKGK